MLAAAEDTNEQISKHTLLYDKAIFKSLLKTCILHSDTFKEKSSLSRHFIDHNNSDVFAQIQQDEL